MDNYEELKKEIEKTHQAVGIVVHVLNKMNTAMEEGFGKDGMQGGKQDTR